MYSVEVILEMLSFRGVYAVGGSGAVTPTMKGSCWWTHFLIVPWAHMPCSMRGAGEEGRAHLLLSQGWGKPQNCSCPPPTGDACRDCIQHQVPAPSFSTTSHLLVWGLQLQGADVQRTRQGSISGQSPPPTPHSVPAPAPGPQVTNRGYTGVPGRGGITHWGHPPQPCSSFSTAAPISWIPQAIRKNFSGDGGSRDPAHHVAGSEHEWFWAFPCPWVS